MQQIQHQKALEGLGKEIAAVSMGNRKTEPGMKEAAERMAQRDLLPTFLKGLKQGGIDHACSECERMVGRPLKSQETAALVEAVRNRTT